jgi:cytochrome P450
VSGEILDLDARQPAYSNDPYPLYAQLRESAPVRRVILGSLPAWLVTRYDDVRQALADPRLSTCLDNLDPALAEAGAWILGERMMHLDRHMLRSDPPAHTRLRRLVAKAFTPGRIEALRPRVADMAGQLMAEFLPRGRAELVSEFAFPLPLMAIMELLGMPLADRDQFRIWAEMTLPGASGQEQGYTAIRAYLAQLVEDKTRHSGGADLLSALVSVREQGQRLDENELLSMAWLLLTAGHTTTVDLIASGTLALLRNPGQHAALRADPALLGPAIEELLRYDSPVEIAIARFTTTDVAIGGTVIPGGGQVVFIAVASADRDPQRFPGPDRLDLRRQPTGHLAFGHGIHYCLGAPLARMEGTVAFRALLDRCAGLALAIDPRDITWQINPHLRGPAELPVTFAPVAAEPIS